MNKIIITFLFYFVLGHLHANVFPVHEFHLSKCNIEYKEAEQAIQITLHVFIDDLESALREKGIDQLYIGSEKEKENANQYIQEYLLEKFQLKSDTQRLQLTFLGKEQSEDLAAIWCYLEVTDVNTIKHLTVTNNVLMDVFDDQKNIVSIKGPQKKSAYFLFEKGKSTESVQF